MPVPEANGLTQLLPVTGVVLGTVDISEETISAKSGPTDVARDDVSMVKDSTGRVTITIQNFKGPQGVAFCFGTARSPEIIVGAAAYSYSGDAVSVQFLLEDDAGTATDDDFDFQIWAA